MPTVTCHTPGCGNADVPIEVETPVDADTQQPVAPWEIICGPCGQPIQDVTG